MLARRPRHLVPFLTALAAGWFDRCGLAGDHPRLLLSADDLPRLRHLCGLTPAGTPATGWSRFGSRAADFQALREYFAARPAGEVVSGELPAAAFLHLVDPHDPADVDRRSLINATLLHPTDIGVEMLEPVIALDWCWESLEPQARQEFLIAARKWAEPLTPADSPLEPRRFRRRLAALALAVAVDEIDEPSPSWLAVRTRLLEAGRDYFKTTFPTFVQWRTLSPTGPAVAAREECDAALALELAGPLMNRNMWPDYRTTLGRWLEHYVLATIDHPALQHNFLRDDGSNAPLTPVPVWTDFFPVTAHLIAARTADPAAALIADRIEERMRQTPEPDLRNLWRWVPIAFELAKIPRCRPDQLPTARNLGGAVIFRGDWGADATVVWVDAGQPFLRRRQHYDAGHFLIRRGGELAVDGGDDVAFEAVASKGGSQHLGELREPFDFEQYFTASIAHNCLVVWDPAQIIHWYGRRYLPVGGQRCIEDTCGDFVAPLGSQQRQTGQQLAYGQKHAAAYLALDLTAAYERRVVSSYTRQLLFLWGRALLVLDRVTLRRTYLTPTWILNLPARPQVDAADLADQARVAGSTNEGGVWRYDRARWLRWVDRDGCLWMNALLPANKCLRIVGGPARKLRIEQGSHADRLYVGGDPDGFERLIIPAERHNTRNAWYRLGRPTLLGPEFDKTPHWGRIELEPADKAPTVTFLTLLVTDRADSTQAPTANLTCHNQTLELHLAAGQEQATVRLSTDQPVGGELEVRGSQVFSWSLPTEVLPDDPLPAD